MFLLTCIWIAMISSAAFILFILLYYKFYSVSFWQKMHKIPSPKHYFIIGIGYLAAKIDKEDLLVFLESLWKELGDVFYVSIMGWTTVLITNPEDIEILFSNKKYLKKGYEYSILSSWMGEGLLTSTGVKWHLRRKQLTPAFHFKILQDYIPVLNQNACALVMHLQQCSNSPVEIGSIVSVHTLNIISETTMGTQLNLMSREATEYIAAIKRYLIHRCKEIVHEKSQTFWYYNDWIFSCFPIGREYKTLIRKIHTFVKNIISQRKKSYDHKKLMKNDIDKPSSEESEHFVGIYSQRKSFLDHLFDIQEANPEILTDFDILDEVNTFLFEGHDTISAAITWVLFMLSLHSDIQDRVRDEITSVLLSNNDISAQEINRLHYLDMVIKETLRLYPSVPYVTRNIPEDLQLRKYVIPAKANVAVLPYLTHRDPTIFDDPEKFDPERFSPGRSGFYHPYAYLPFSAGYRNCIGQRFAMMEAKVVLSIILKNLQVLPTQKRQEIKIAPSMVLQACPKIMLVFQPIQNLLSSKKNL